jgi:hypothetical protein
MNTRALYSLLTAWALHNPSRSLLDHSLNSYAGQSHVVVHSVYPQARMQAYCCCNISMTHKVLTLSLTRPVTGAQKRGASVQRLPQCLGILQYHASLRGFLADLEGRTFSAVVTRGRRSALGWRASNNGGSCCGASLLSCWCVYCYGTLGRFLMGSTDNLFLSVVDHGTNNTLEYCCVTALVAC